MVIYVVIVTKITSVTDQNMFPDILGFGLPSTRQVLSYITACCFDHSKLIMLGIKWKANVEIFAIAAICVIFSLFLTD